MSNADTGSSSDPLAHQSPSFVVRNAYVLDEGGGFEKTDLVVEHGSVTATGRNARAGEHLPQFDFSGLWIMPGVFDCHTHVAYSSLDLLEQMDMPISQWALEAGRNMSRTLGAGVTFVRDAGGADAGMRTAVDTGCVEGPDMQISVVMISQTGGHFDFFQRGTGAEVRLPDYPGRPPHLVDGADSMRRAVRSTLRAGADWIKLSTTGGIASPHDDCDVAELTVDEVSVAVSEAARRNKGVMVHAFGGEGVDIGIAAGVRSIEHAPSLTEAQAERMAAEGIWLVPTLWGFHDAVRLAESGEYPPYASEKALRFKGTVGDCVPIAREYGVNLAIGADLLSREQHGSNLQELKFMHEAGLTAEETLLAATIGGARLCGVDHVLGRIAPGFRFDGIVLDRDPSEISTTFSCPDSVSGVFKGGRPVVRHPLLRTHAASEAGTRRTLSP